MNRDQLELSTLARHFEVHNRSEGKSLRTVEWYNEVLALFHDWLEGEGLPTSLDRIWEEEVRAFFAWLHRRGYTEEHRLKDLRPPRVTEKVIEPLTPDEIKKIFDSINPATLLGARNTAIYSLMLDTGLRLSEVVTLKYEYVHLEDRYIKVLGKGSKERVVAFGSTCQRSLLHYAYHYRIEPVHSEVDTFFLSIDGYSLFPAALRSITKRVAKSAGVPRLHPHLLRHTYATQFLLNGGDVFLLKQNLGHTTLAMVEHYVHIASRVAVLRSEGFSPLDRFDLPGVRRFRHGFNPESPKGKIYPNAHGSSRGQRSRSKRSSAEP